MARARYTITTDDYPHARDYLERHDLDAAGGSRKSKTDQLNEWCEDNLDSEGWGRLKAAIRKRRQRLAQGDAVVNIAISRDTHELLSRRAQRDGVTLDAALKMLLRRR